MNEKTHADDLKTEQNEAKGYASEKKTSKSSERSSKWKEKKTDSKAKGVADNDFCELLKINLSIFNVGALYSGVKSLFKVARKIDTKVAIYMDKLYKRVSDHFKKSIESYKENK